jgi:predicted PurR-regulated permease PerM
MNMNSSVVRTPPGPPEEKGLVHRALIVIGVAVAIVVLLVLLWYIADVLLLAFAGILLAILLRTPADWLSRNTPLSPGWSLALVILVIISLLGIGGWLFGRSAVDQMTQLFSKALPQSIDALKERVQPYEWGNLLIQQVQPANLVSGKVLGKGIDAISATFGIIANIVVVLFIALFLAVQPDLYIRGLVRLVPIHRRQRIREVLSAMGHTLQWWLIGQVFLMLVIGVLIGLGLWLLKVPLALALAILAGLLTFIPYLGPILSAVPAVLFALTISSTLAFYVVLLYVGVQTVESYLLDLNCHNIVGTFGVQV